SPTDGRGVIIRDIAIRYCQPKPSGAGWAPRDYPYAIRLRADDTYLHNIFLLNPTRGISVENPTGAVGRVVLDRIWGQPLLAGIQIDDAKDVVTVNNVHFWPFWSQTDHISSYQMRNGHAIRSFRNDNPRFSNIFALGYANGFYFGR